MNNDQAVAQVQHSRGEVEFIPFGADSKIKLSVKIIKDFVAIPTKSGKLPEDRDCMKFMMLCRARKLNPFEGDCFLQGYDGRDGAQFSLITAHQAFLKRAEVNPEFDGMRSGVIVRNDNDEIVDRIGDFCFPGDVLLGGWAIVMFKTRKTPTERRLNLSTFDQGFGRWQKDKAGMIVKCAEADALRSSFPTMLGGLYSEQEMQQVIDVSPSVKSPAFDQGGLSRQKLPPAEEKRFSGEAQAAPKPSQDAPQGVSSQSEASESSATQPAPASAQEQAESSTVEKAQAPQESKPTKAPFVPRNGATDELNNVLFLMHRDDVTEAQIIAWAKAGKLMKAEQKDLAELSTQKLTNIGKSWDNIVPEIRKH